MHPSEPLAHQPAPGSGAVKPASRRRGCGCGLGAVALSLALLVVVWFVIQPGIFVIQPLQSLPEGITIVYYSRPASTPLVLSPDGVCLETMGEVTLICRMAGIAAASRLTDRILMRLPYSHSLYLLSTGGREFDR